MAGDWRACRLGDVIELKRGFDLPASKRHDGKVPIVSSSGISGAHSEAMVASPGVVTGRYGTIGQVFYITQDFWPLNTTLYVCDFKGSVPRFVAYFLQTIDFLTFSDKAAVPGINRNHLHEAEIVWPPEDEQHAIAELLGTLDDKIELNRRLVETLEPMVRALFKSWFIDFDPVHAKAEGRPTRLPDALAALFPKTFGEDGLPVGWERVPLMPSLARSVVRGLAPAYATSGIVVLNQRCVRDSKVDLSNARRHDAQRRLVSGERLIEPGDIVINSTGVGTLGRVGQVRRLREPLTADSHLTIVKPDATKVSGNFLGMSLLDLEPFIETLGHGSTGQTELSRESVGALQIVVPDKNVQDAFDRITVPLRDRADAALEEVVTLAQLRDSLLPKLISGELRIADAEKRIAAA